MERHCPRCGTTSLRPVRTVAGATNLLCPTCRRCWAPEFGYLIEVNSLACAGCPERGLCRGA